MPSRSRNVTSTDDNTSWFPDVFGFLSCIGDTAVCCAVRDKTTDEGRGMSRDDRPSNMGTYLDHRRPSAPKPIRANGRPRGANRTDDFGATSPNQSSTDALRRQATGGDAGFATSSAAIPRGRQLDEPPLRGSLTSRDVPRQQRRSAWSPQGDDPSLLHGTPPQHQSGSFSPSAGAPLTAAAVARHQREVNDDTHSQVGDLPSYGTLPMASAASLPNAAMRSRMPAQQARTTAPRPTAPIFRKPTLYPRKPEKEKIQLATTGPVMPGRWVWPNWCLNSKDPCIEVYVVDHECRNQRWVEAVPKNRVVDKDGCDAFLGAEYEWEGEFYCQDFGPSHVRGRSSRLTVMQIYENEAGSE
eukprot:NODE_8442_length_1495_cov_6.519006.p2 GENE.NODE_8442_length_1495_cov_6.519006~~NODE_8442_length_1495_cov_6.519006.p2  ORF type:complete len:356 (+),score=54.75 NODE_8442_length_1495_cov_6.519006:127-1194(+)